MTGQYIIEIKSKKKKQNVSPISSEAINETEPMTATTNNISISSIEHHEEGCFSQSGLKIAKCLIIQINLVTTIYTQDVQETSVHNEEDTNPKSWHNTFQQKVQTRSAFFKMW